MADLADVVVSTVTLARDAAEKETIERGLRALSDRGFPAIVVADGGSAPEFVDTIARIPRVILTVPKGPGLQGQVLASLRAARDRNPDWVFYTEPNKPDFFHENLESFFRMARRHLSQSTSAILPARTAPSFATYPTIQQQTESKTSQLLSFLLGRTGDEDLLHGPRLLAPALIQHLDRLGSDVGWGWLSYMLHTAHFLRQDIVTIPMDLPCPPPERRDNLQERLLRLGQMRDHLSGMAAALLFLRKMSAASVQGEVQVARPIWCHQHIPNVPCSGRNSGFQDLTRAACHALRAA